jgi:hypothetical protein
MYGAKFNVAHSNDGNERKIDSKRRERDCKLSKDQTCRRLSLESQAIDYRLL